MSISITIDNDRVAAGIQNLIEDESSGVQTPGTTDTGNEINVTLTNPVGGSLGGFQTGFNTFLNGSMLGMPALTDAQKVFASTNDGASSSADFVKVTASNGETVSDLFFSDSAGAALDGDQVFISAGVPMQTVSGDNIYLWSNGDFCIATTSATAGAGRVVAAFYLNDADANHLQAQVQMVTFEPLSHPVAGSTATAYDDALNFSNVLQVSAAGSQSFDFDALKSSGALWVAVGNNQTAIVVSGYSLDVDGAGKLDGTSDKIAVSQGGTGTTIGLNNQLFDANGERAVFTLASGLDSLTSADGGVLSDYIVDHTGPAAEGLNYTGYINVTGAGIFLSQSQGTPTETKDFDIDLYHAGGASNTPETGFNYIGTEPSGAFLDDTAVNAATVTIKDDQGNLVATWVAGADPDGAGPLLGSGATIHHVSTASGAAGNNVTVTITGNNIDIGGVLGGYTVSWTSAGGATFNRFTLKDEGAGKFDVGRVDLVQGVSSHTPVGGNLVVQDDGPSITGTISGAPTPTVDESNFAIDGTGNFAAQFSPVYGTDGAAAANPVTYALSTPGGNSGLVDTATGQNVVLSLNGSGQVEGRTATSNDLVFVVSVSAAGVVTLDEKRAIVHADTNDPNDSRTLSSASLVVLTATAHDKDGDSASTPLNIGTQLIFQDDGPSITGTISGAPTPTVDESNFAIDGTGSFAAQFSPVYGADGQAATPVTYGLSTPGGASGLTDTATGESVVLSFNSATGNVEGKTATTGLLVFVVSVSAAGVVTLDEKRAIVHADTNDPNDSRTLSSASLVVLTATAHDKDGDSALTPLNIGTQLIFQDDGPSITGTISGAPTPTVDESNFAIDGTGSFAAQFSPVYGADGQAATPVTYGLSTPGGASGLTDTATGESVVLSFNSATGNVEGKTAITGLLVFVVSVSAAGDVTLDEKRAIVHADTNDPNDSRTLSSASLVVLTATAHDKDGDTAFKDLNIGTQLIFQDDGPSITASSTGAPSITDDESDFTTNNFASYAAQFTPVYGADGSAGTPVTYGISATANADSGLIESGTGNHVFLFNESGTVVGRAGTSAAAAAGVGHIVFVASVDGTGKVTLDQRLAVVHTPNVTANDVTTLSSSGLVTVTATAHDGDGDTASAGLPIGTLLNFQDDAPTITSQILDGTVAFVQNASTSHSLNGAIAADGTSSLQTSLSGTAEYTITYWDTTPVNVFPNLNPVLSNNGTVLTYYSDAADTNAVYRLTLDPLANSGQGSYTFTVLQPPPFVSSNFAFTDLPSGQNLLGVVATDKADLTKGGLLVFPSNPVLNADGTFTNTSGTINTSKGGGPVTIGNGNQAFDSAQEGAYFMYVDNPTAASVGGVGLTQTGADDADTIGFTNMNQSTDSSVTIVQASGAGTDKRPGPSIQIHAWEAASNTTVNSNSAAEALVNNPVVATGATEVDITGIKIHDSTGAVIEYRTVIQTAGGANFGDLHGADSAVGIQFILVDAHGAGTADDVYSAVVSNLKANYTIEFLTASNHNIALVQNVSGSFDIGGFSASNQVTVPAQDFHFAATITDYDNDAYGGHLATFADWNVHIDPFTV